MGGLELLVICSIVGGLFGLVFKAKATARWIGFMLGMIGAVVVTFC